MKKICAFIVLFTLTLAVTSCSKDNKEAALEGQWEISRAGLLINGNEFLFPYEHTPGCNKDYVDFVAGGVYKMHFFEKVDTECEVYIESGVWSRSGNTIAIIVEGDLSTAEIVTLTATTLKLRITYDDDDDFLTFVAEYIRK